MASKICKAAALAIAVGALLATSTAPAHDMSEHEKGHRHGGLHAQAVEDHSRHGGAAASREAAAEPALIKLSDKPLIDSEGRSLQLKNDVIGDRVVVINLVFTACTTVCPVSSAIISDLQSKLGDRVGRDVRLVTLTVDPARDTPEQLKNYSARFGAGPGWLWLTGSSANVNAALKGLGVYTPNFENHPVIVLIGDGRTGKWSRHYALSHSDKLLARVDEYLAARRKKN